MNLDYAWQSVTITKLLFDALAHCKSSQRVLKDINRLSKGHQCSPQAKFKACQGILWVEAVTTSKILESPYSYIKVNSVLKACWADMPYVCRGEHCCQDMFEHEL